MTLKIKAGKKEDADFKSTKTIGIIILIKYGVSGNHVTSYCRMRSWFNILLVRNFPNVWGSSYPQFKVIYSGNSGLENRQRMWGHRDGPSHLNWVDYSHLIYLKKGCEVAPPLNRLFLYEIWSDMFLQKGTKPIYG